jgi:signal transduction histidine kinase
VRFKWSLGQLLLLAFLLTSILPISLMARMSYTASAETSRQQAENSAVLVTSMHADHVSRTLEQVSGLLDTVERMPPSAPTNSTPYTENLDWLIAQVQMGDQLERFARIQDVVSIDLVVPPFDPDGLPEMHFHAGELLSGGALRTQTVQRLWRETLAAGRETYWAGLEQNINVSSHVTQTLTATRLTTFAPGKPALLIVALDPTTFISRLDVNHAAAHLILTDEKGQILVGTGEFQRAVILEPALSRGLDGDSGTFTASVNGEEVFVTYAKASAGPWFVISVTPVAEITAGADQSRRLTTLLVFACVLAAILLAAYVATLVLTPIRQITQNFEMARTSATADLPKSQVKTSRIREINHLLSAWSTYAEGQVRRVQAEAAQLEDQRFLTALQSSTTALTMAIGEDDMLQRILAEAATVVPHEKSDIMVVDEMGSTRLVALHGYSAADAESLRSQWRISLAELPNLAEMASCGMPAKITDPTDPTQWNQHSGTEWIRCALSVALRQGDHLVGFLNLNSSIPHFFTEDHARRMALFASQAVLALEKSQLLAADRTRAAELELAVATRTAALESANASLRDLANRLQELDRMKSQFVAGISHELRTPLTNIKTYASLLRDGKPERRRHYLDVLDDQSKLLQRLIEQVLELSSLDLGKVKPILARVDLNELVAHLVNDRSALFAARAQNVTLQLAPDLGNVLADDRLVANVLGNLLTNAMNFTPAGGAIAVTTARDQSGCSVTISNTGPPIPTHEQPHIFERFYRGQAALDSGVAGTGLGLAICREIIERHGGTIAMANGSNGTTFTITLPLEADHP